MRGAGKIASLLSIATRTVETHTANIMRKMDSNSREGIIDFVERAGHAPWIDTHYRNLLVQSEFKNYYEKYSDLFKINQLIAQFCMKVEMKILNIFFNIKGTFKFMWD